MITSLNIQHFRSIENINLNLNQVNVFVGQNGAGKSNIIDALRFIRDAVENGLDQAVTDRHGMTHIRQWSPFRPYDVSMRVDFQIDQRRYNSVGNFGFTVTSSRDSYSVKKETCENYYESLMTVRPGRKSVKASQKFDRENEKIRLINKGEQIELNADDATDLIIDNMGVLFGFNHVVTELTRLQTYSIFPNTLREPQKQSKERFLTSHGDNVSSIIKRMRAQKKTSALNQIISAMRLVIPDLENVTVQALGGFIVPRFFIKPLDGKGHYFEVDQVSDGALRILGILVALYQDPGPSVIALEEPELAVHPGIAQMVAEAIKEVGREKQVIVTTHSPELLDYFEPEDIVAVEYADGVTTANPINKAQIQAVQQQLFSLGELMSVEGLHG